MARGMSDYLKERTKTDAKELWIRFVSGDREAFSALFTEVYPPLFRYATASGLSELQADDAIQDIFIRLLEKPGLIRNPATVLPYLFRSIKNASLKVYARKVRLLSLETAAPRATFEFACTIDEEAAAGFDAQKLREELRRMLEALSPRQREIVYLRLIEEMDYPTISLVMNITPQVARNLFSKSLHKLRGLGLESTLFLLVAALVSKNLLLDGIFLPR